MPIVETQVAKGTYPTPPSLFNVLSFNVVGGVIWGCYVVSQMRGTRLMCISGIEICGVYEFVGYWQARVDGSISRGRTIYFSSRREIGVIIS